MNSFKNINIPILTYLYNSQRNSISIIYGDEQFKASLDIEYNDDKKQFQSATFHCEERSGILKCSFSRLNKKQANFSGSGISSLAVLPMIQCIFGFQQTNNHHWARIIYEKIKLWSTLLEKARPIALNSEPGLLREAARTLMYDFYSIFKSIWVVEKPYPQIVQSFNDMFTRIEREINIVSALINKNLAADAADAKDSKEHDKPQQDDAKRADPSTAQKRARDSESSSSNTQQAKKPKHSHPNTDSSSSRTKETDVEMSHSDLRNLSLFPQQQSNHSNSASPGIIINIRKV